MKVTGVLPLNLGKSCFDPIVLVQMLKHAETSYTIVYFRLCSNNLGKAVMVRLYVYMCCPHFTYKHFVILNMYLFYCLCVKNFFLLVSTDVSFYLFIDTPINF